MNEFRLITNKSVRIASARDLRSRASLARAAYTDLSRDHSIHKQYIPSAFEVALAALKAHRHRVRKGRKSSIPYFRRPLLKSENQSYQFNRETGRLRIPIRGTEGVQLDLTVSDWHRSFLNDPSWALGSLTIVPGRIHLVVRKEGNDPYPPASAMALDTNQASLDGVVFDGVAQRVVTLALHGVREIQARHFRRRRLLARRKAHDRRVRGCCFRGKEGGSATA